MISRCIPLVCVFACGGIKPDEFNEQYSEALCTLLFDCQEAGSTVFVLGEDVGDCQGLFALAYASAEETCDFDEDAAESCLDAISEVSCETLYTSTALLSCTSVYTGAECSVATDTKN